MKVLILYDKSGPKYHRLLLPCFLMPGVELILNHKLEEHQLEGVDILFFNRMITRTSIENIEKLREKYGFKLIVDFDDHWNLDPSHILFKLYQYHNTSAFMVEYIKIADAVFVTHDRLAKEVKPFNKKAYVLPNAIPEFGQFKINKIPDDKLRFFWAGSPTHVKDIELLRNPIKRIHQKGIKWVMGGYTPTDEMKAIRTFFTNGGRNDHEIIEALPVEDYYYCYSKCDVAMVPLVNNPFNSYKSNLKILEAGNIAAPVIVSKVHPYLDVPHVNYVETQSDWYRQSKRLIDDKVLRDEQGQALKEWCKENFDFNMINLKRKQIFDYETGKQR